METIIYLKQNTLGATGVKAYNKKQLTSIEYFECGNEIQSVKKRYDDVQDLNWSLRYDIGNRDYEFTISDRETFNKVAIEDSNFTNFINAEL